jgi:alpha-glucoside transport system permease protein
MSPVIQALLTIVIGVGGCVGYFYGANVLLDKVLFPARGENAGRNITRANMIRPWIFLFPAMVALGLYLAYPVVASLRLSLLERLPGNQYAFVGFENYTRMFAEPKFIEAMRNNMLWLIVVPAMSTAFGLLVAQLTDTLKWGNIAKSIVFMPMAISLVGASVIFKLIYEARPADAAQIGVLNAVWMQFDGGIGAFLALKALPILFLICFGILAAYVAWILIRPITSGDGGGAMMTAIRVVGGLFLAWLAWLSVSGIFGVATADLPYGEPQQWLTIPLYNNFFLMVVLIWIQTGFAMVILSAALRGIPEDTVEAAIIDGANPFEVFFHIKIPQIMGTIVVVWTTITITVLKVFDIVFAMTNGQWETQVLANYMYDKLFRANDWGMGSAAAMIIMLLVTPILAWNVYNARKEMR